MKFIPILAVLLSAFATLSFAQSGTETTSAIVDGDFVDVGGRWGAGGRSIAVMVRIGEENGYYTVCASTSGIRNSTDRRALQAYKIMLNGSVMLRDLRWALNHSGNPMGQTARCRRTDSRVVSNPEFGVEMQRTRF